MMLLRILALALITLLSVSLWYLHRFDEIHHGYVGAFLVAATIDAPFSHVWIFWFGIVLIADDAVQHAWEAICLLRRVRVPPDFTPIHKMGAWILGAFYQLRGH